MADINETDARVFVESVTRYFEHLTGSAAEIRTAYLASGALPRYEYTGSIEISGQFSGTVYFSATGVIAAGLLLAMHENDTSGSNLLDIVGEVANTISGNARRHYGAGLEISPPVTSIGDAMVPASPTRDRPFAIELKWQQSDAVVVVDVISNS